MPSTRRLLNRCIHAARRRIEWYGAIAPGTDAADGFGSFGVGSCIAYPPATLYGTQSIHVGDGTLVGRHCSLLVGYTPEDTGLPERALVIGDRCVIGAWSTITAHESITIGDDVWCGPDVFISDASHGYQDPDTPIGRQLGEHQPVVVGAGSWLGHGAVVLPGTTLGRNVVVGAGSVVRGTVPDHAVVAGVPARVVRRLDPDVGWLRADGTGAAREVRTAQQTTSYFASLAGG